MKPETRRRFSDVFISYQRTKHPQTPIHYLVPDKPSEGSANALTTTIVKFLLQSGHFAERISNQGQYRDESKEVTNVLGHKYRIGSGRWTKGQGTNGTADISAQIKVNGQRFAVPIKIEIKFGNDRQSDAQKTYQANVEATGSLYWIVRDLDGFLKQYDELCLQ